MMVWPSDLEQPRTLNERSAHGFEHVNVWFRTELRIPKQQNSQTTKKDLVMT